MKRNLALDLLKVLLAAFVVGIHSYFLKGPGSWIGDISVNGLFRIAVPVFFAINGYYFSRILENEQLVPWLKKVVVLYVVWMLVFLPFYFPDSLKPVSAILFLKTLVLGYHHIWYLSAFIFSGLLIYLLRKRSPVFLATASILLFLTGVALQYGRAYVTLPAHGINQLLDIEWVSRNFLFIAFPFMMTGVLIRRYNLASVLSMRLIWGLLIPGMIFLLLEANNNYIWLKATRHSFDCLLALAIVCPLLFLAASKSNRVHESRRLSDLSMVIYFVHPLFISFLVDGLSLVNNGINITVWTLFLSVLVFPVHNMIKSIVTRTLQPTPSAG